MGGAGGERPRAPSPTPVRRGGHGRRTRGTDQWTRRQPRAGKGGFSASEMTGNRTRQGGRTVCPLRLRKSSEATPFRDAALLRFQRLWRCGAFGGECGEPMRGGGGGKWIFPTAEAVARPVLPRRMAFVPFQKMRLCTGGRRGWVGGWERGWGRGGHRDPTLPCHGRWGRAQRG